MSCYLLFLFQQYLNTNQKELRSAKARYPNPPWAPYLVKLLASFSCVHLVQIVFLILVTLTIVVTFCQIKDSFKNLLQFNLLVIQVFSKMA